MKKVFSEKQVARIGKKKHALLIQQIFARAALMALSNNISINILNNFNGFFLFSKLFLSTN